MNPLIIHLHPKDGLDETATELKKIPCDKLILKYFPYPIVYHIANRTIKDHPEYDYIIWMAPDVIFTTKHFEELCYKIKKYELDILGAACNVDLTESGLETLAFTVKPFEISPGMAVPFVQKKEFSGLVKVFHNGGVFIAKREFYLKYPCVGFGKSGYNADIKQGMDIYKDKINYYVDTDIFIKHLRYQGIMQVGKKEPRVTFEKY